MVFPHKRSPSIQAYEAVVIGTSAGGMNALGIILSELDRNFPLPIIIVQHMHPDSDDYLIKVLEEASPGTELEDQTLARITCEAITVPLIALTVPTLKSWSAPDPAAPNRIDPARII